MVDPNEYELAARRLYAAALKILRERAGLTQEQAAEKRGITLTAWQNYEYAKRRFTRRLIEEVTSALDATPEDLELIRASLEPREETHSALELPMDGRVRAGPKGMHVYDGGPPQTMDFSRYFGPDWRVLQLGGESMIPYAEPGGFVTYNVDRSPQRNKGCVIRTKTGEFYVKRFDRIVDGKLFVTELHPVERQLEFDMETEVAGIYPVGLRVD